MISSRWVTLAVKTMELELRRAPVLLGMLSPLIFHAPAAAGESSWRDLLSQAETASAEGKNDESVRAARAALADAERELGAEAPEIGHILARLARHSVETEDTSIFLELKKRLSGLKHKDFETWMALGVLLGREGRFSEAESAMRKGLALKPDDDAATLELAVVVRRLGRYEDAIRLLKKGIQRSPRDYWMHVELAQNYVSLGRYAQAKEMFARAKRINSHERSAYIHEGYALINAGEDANAKESFQSLIDLRISSYTGYHHMASYFIQRGRPSEAEGCLRRALQELEAGKNTDIHDSDLLHTLNNLGTVLAEQGRREEAEAVFRRGLEKMSPKNDYRPRFLIDLAEIYAAQGKNEQAEDHFKQAVTLSNELFLFPEHQSALTALGDFYLKQGRRAEAVMVADRAYELFSGPLFWDPGHMHDDLPRLAKLQVDLGNVAKGEALYLRIAALRRTIPFNSAITKAETGLADLYAARGRLREAEDLYRQAIRDREHAGDREGASILYDRLAAAYEKEGKRQESDEAREKSKILKTGF